MTTPPPSGSETGELRAALIGKIAASNKCALPCACDHWAGPCSNLADEILALWNTRAQPQADGEAAPKPIGEGGLWGMFARSAERFSNHKGTIEITLTAKEIQHIAAALRPAPTETVCDQVQARTINLLEAIRDNDWDDMAADAVTCGQVWKKEAADILALHQPEPSVCDQTRGEMLVSRESVAFKEHIKLRSATTPTGSSPVKQE